MFIPIIIIYYTLPERRTSAIKRSEVENNMTKQTDLFCRLIILPFHPEKISLWTSDEKKTIQDSLFDYIAMARLHNVIPLFYQALCLLKIPLPDAANQLLEDTVLQKSMALYHMLSFTREVISILNEEAVHYQILKGISLLDSYPMPEFRPFNDLDILISDEDDFQKACHRFEKDGFIPEKAVVDHHLEFYYQKGPIKFLLELHHKITPHQPNKIFNQNVTQIFYKKPINQGFLDLAKLSYPMLPVTENALHLLLHMLQHFLSSGFGIKLLLDWCAYLTKYEDTIDWKLFQKYIHLLGLTGFCNAMTRLCKKYMGFHLKNESFLLDKVLTDPYLNTLMTDIMAGGEFGKNNSSRMVAMYDSSIRSYLKEFHSQMHRRFKKLANIPILWPVLWFLTGCIFVQNNIFLRKTKTKDILISAKKRADLLKQLELYKH